jgi:hypothetical protein
MQNYLLTYLCICTMIRVLNHWNVSCDLDEDQPLSKKGNDE